MRIKALLTGVMALCLIPALSQALAVPEGKAAVIEAVVGKVKLTVGGKTSKAKVGLALAFGDSLNTGANGRVSLRHAGNAISRLAPNTELTLQAPGEKKGIFMRLKLGAVRYLVGKRAPGETFEVETSNAVAAVKGTDAETSTDGKSTRSSVFESAREKALELLDKKSGKSEDLSPGQTAEADDNGIDKRELTEDEKQASEKQYDGLPEPKNDEAKNGEGQGGDQQQQQAQQGGEQRNGEQGGEQGSGESRDELVDDIQDAFASVMDDLGLDSFLDRDERTGDLVAGRIVYDRNGDRAQVSAYILRPEPNQVYKANFTRRDAGPFAGTTSAEEITTWSTTLPENWYDAVKMPLDDPSNLDANGYPILYRVSQDFMALNPQQDELYIYTAYDAPRYNAYFDGNGYTVDLLNPTVDPVQGFVREVYTGSATSGLSLVFTHQLYQSYYNDYIVAGRQLSYNNNYYSSYWQTNQTVTADGGISLGLNFGGPDFLTTEFRVLDNEGNIIDLSSAPGGLVDHDFKGLDNELNLEVTFNAPVFSAPIDLMFIPEVFDSMDILDLPYSSNGGA